MFFVLDIKGLFISYLALLRARKDTSIFTDIANKFNFYLIAL